MTAISPLGRVNADHEVRLLQPTAELAKPSVSRSENDVAEPDFNLAHDLSATGTAAKATTVITL